MDLVDLSTSEEEIHQSLKRRLSFRHPVGKRSVIWRYFIEYEPTSIDDIIEFSPETRTRLCNTGICLECLKNGTSDTVYEVNMSTSRRYVIIF